MDSKEITRYAIQLEKLQNVGDYGVVSCLLADLSISSVTLEQLQTTDIAKTVYHLLKLCPVAHIRKTAKGLLSEWKRLYGSSYGHRDTKGTQIKQREPPEESSTELLLSAPRAEQQIERRVSEGAAVLCHSGEHSSVSQHPGFHSGLKPSMSSERTTLYKTQERGKDFGTISVVPPGHSTFTDSTSLRTKCVELLLQALTPSQKIGSEDKGHLSTIAQSIENNIYTLHGQNQAKYKACIRSRIANLKNPKNPQLRQGLLTGTLSSEVFAQMSVEDMAGEELRRLREGYTAAAISEHQLPQRLEGTTTTKVRCWRCQGMDCRVTQLPRGTLFLPSWVRSSNADEEAMTFMTCAGCGDQWYHNRWVCL